MSIATARECVLLANRTVSLDPSAPSDSLDANEFSADRAWHAHHLLDRLNRLLWVLRVNGAVVALVGIISTVESPSKVLWLLQHEAREGNPFGPFFYRNHVAAFANLFWPVCLGPGWRTPSAPSGVEAASLLRSDVRGVRCFRCAPS